jgi:CDP-diacylglycerol--glycerol-3-phosphate 3-phosphatidyltransferase
MIEGLKPAFNAILRPIVRPLAFLHIHPNHLTIAGLLLFAGGALMIQKGIWKASLWLVVAGALFDGLDGVLARETGKKSVFGGILDSTCDRLTEIVLLLGVLSYYLTAPVFVLFTKAPVSLRERGWGVALCYTAICMSLMVSYVKARCEGAGIKCNRGLLQRPERIILMCLGIFLGPKKMVWMLGVLSILGGLTVLERIIQAWLACRKNSTAGNTQP